MPTEYLDLDLVVPTRAGLPAGRPAEGGPGAPHRAVRAHRDQLRQRPAGGRPGRRRPGAGRHAAKVMPERVLLDAGRSGDVLVEARGPRMIFGSEVDRPVTVTATARAGGRGRPADGRRDRADRRGRDVGVRRPGRPARSRRRTRRAGAAAAERRADAAAAALDHPGHADRADPARHHRGLGGGVPVRPAGGVRQRPAHQDGADVVLRRPTSRCRRVHRSGAGPQRAGRRAAQGRQHAVRPGRDHRRDGHRDQQRRSRSAGSWSRRSGPGPTAAWTPASRRPPRRTVRTRWRACSRAATC